METDLKKILAISGQPGLFSFVAQSANGVIVESLADGHRINAPASSKVSSMGEISIFTDSDDVPLAKVFEALYAHTGGKPAIGHKSDPAELKKLFAAILPDYDRDRVHVSDMKKVVSWFNILIDKGMTEFRIDEEQTEMING
jgi:hypothetical protein